MKKDERKGAQRGRVATGAELVDRVPHTSLTTGVVCGVRVESVEDPLMQKIHWMDKLVDDPARGRTLGKIIRG